MKKIHDLAGPMLAVGFLIKLIGHTRQYSLRTKIVF